MMGILNDLEPTFSSLSSAVAIARFGKASEKQTFFQILKKKMWRSWDLNSGLPACEAGTLPLSYTPNW